MRLSSEILNGVQSFLPTTNTRKLHGALSYLEDDIDSKSILDVIKILVRFKVDEETVLAFILYNAFKDKDIPEDLRMEFGDEIFQIVTHLLSFNDVKISIEDSEVENLRMMFLALAKDIRVILIKLAMGLQHLKKLHLIRNKEERVMYARQALDIYIPIAARLGIYSIKSEMEDLAFSYLYPERYYSIYKDIEKYKKLSEEYIEDIKNKLSEVLKKEGIEGIIQGRVKNIYSIYKKLNKRSRSSISEIFDILALRIVLPDKKRNGEEFTGHLYSLLGAIHRNFTPLKNRFKDYVAGPKFNGYRSLHTTVINLSSLEPFYPVEIQIRTEKMHKEAEFGIASHWLYKQNGYKDDFSIEKPENEEIKNQIEWVKALANLHENNGKNGLSEMEVFENRVFVMTPLGEVKSLSKGATPVDFAYDVNFDLGHQCQLAKVNGKTVPLDYELKNGELIEIIRKNEKKPNRYWLEFVKTDKARKAITSWFEGLEQEKFIKKGRNKVNSVLAKLGRTSLDTNLSLFKSYNGIELSLKEREMILIDIGRGDIAPEDVLKQVLPHEIFNKYKREKQGLGKNNFYHTKNKAKEVLISGETNLPYKIASCCKPIVGEKIVGYVTRGKGVTIHKKNCKTLKSIDKERIIEVNWGGKANKNKKTIQVQVDIEAMDRVGLLRDITNIIAGYNCNIIDFKLKLRKENRIKRRLFFEVENLKQFRDVLVSIKAIDGVTSVN